MKNPSFSQKYLKNKKTLQLDCQRAGNCQLPRQNDFRTFCMSDEIENVYQKLEEVINIC